jgi:acetyl esterase/lipase
MSIRSTLAVLFVFVLSACGTPRAPTDAGPSAAASVAHAPETAVATSAALVAMGGACVTSADCGTGLYCEIGAGALASSFALDHTCQPASSAAIATVSTCTLPSLAAVTPVVITYTTDGLTCSVFQPSTGTNLPVVVALPYGGFVQQFAGNPDFVNYGKQVVASGKVAVLCNYTKATATISGVPAELSDVRCAIRTAGSSALGAAFTAAGGGTYRGSPSRVGVVGSSAGGSLALDAVLDEDVPALALPDTTAPGTYHAPLPLDSGTCIAGTSSILGMVKVLVAAAPPTDLPGPTGYGDAAHPTKVATLDAYAGSAVNPARADALSAVSPALFDMAHPYPGAPKVLLIQSSGDTAVDPAQSAAMDAALAAHGYRHSRILAAPLMCGVTPCSHPWQLTMGGAALAGNCTAWALLATL